MKITRGEWRDKVLIPNIEKAWNKPDDLYGLIVSACHDGFFADLKEASARLLVIDTNAERSHTMRSIVLMKTGQIEGAQAVLRAGIEKVGETGTLLTNLAKVYAERGDTQQADQTLWRAIQLAPNLDNGLGWWAVIHREREGEAGHLRALDEATAIKGSWRPQLWLARHHLEQHEVDSA
ncbi:MAG: tetratricopeptide repeat protein [Rubrivivax sp.]|nr:MAG: tetratricopeptide repeat protein [Rubrivivax sp.]